MLGYFIYTGKNKGNLIVIFEYNLFHPNAYSAEYSALTCAFAFIDGVLPVLNQWPGQVSSPDQLPGYWQASRHFAGHQCLIGCQGTQIK